MGTSVPAYLKEQSDLWEVPICCHYHNQILVINISFTSLLNPEIVSEYVYLSLAQGQEAQGHQAYLSLT